MGNLSYGDLDDRFWIREVKGTMYGYWFEAPNFDGSWM